MSSPNLIHFMNLEILMSIIEVAFPVSTLENPAVKQFQIENFSPFNRKDVDCKYVYYRVRNQSPLHGLLSKLDPTSYNQFLHCVVEDDGVITDSRIYPRISLVETKNDIQSNYELGAFLICYDTIERRYSLTPEDAVFYFPEEKLPPIAETTRSLQTVLSLPERVVCAANEYTYWAMIEGKRVNTRTVVIPGVRHTDVNMRKLMPELRKLKKSYMLEGEKIQVRETEEETQGFLSSRYRFLTRQEAWHMAEANSQIMRRCGGDTAKGGTLYSENLY